jgi:CRISPR-associated exonuclease Cas4
MTLLVWLAAALVAACIAAFAVHRLRVDSAARAERASRPEELAGAGLLYMEKQFRIRGPVPLVARIDRAYQADDGVIVLVELKTRRKSRPYLSDVIQLSAQKMALEGQTGLRVAEHAFVTVQRPSTNARHRSHKVQLMQSSEIVALHRRREGVIAGKVAPRYAHSAGACEGCAFRARCDRPRG